MVWNVWPILAIVQNHFSVHGIDGKGQRIVVQMPVLDLFRRANPLPGGGQIGEIHSADTFSKQHLLSGNQLIELVGGLLPGDDAGKTPCHGGKQHKQERQAETQAQAAKQVHWSPRV